MYWTEKYPLCGLRQSASFSIQEAERFGAPSLEIALDLAVWRFPISWLRYSRLLSVIASFDFQCRVHLMSMSRTLH